MFSSWISMESSFKKTEVKVEFLTDIDILLMVKKEISRGTSPTIHQYVKSSDKYVKDYDKNKNHHILNIGI